MSLSQPYEFIVQWHLTERCNLRCSHCYQSGEPSEELTLKEKLDVIDEVADTLGGWSRDYGLTVGPSFNITGGEPLLCKDLVAVLGVLKTLDAPVYLLSNGTLVTPEWAEKLKGLEVRGVQVSIEGPLEVHDAIRGPGSFKRAMAGVKNLLEAGHVVTLNTTLSAANSERFPEMAGVAASAGVQRLGFSRLVPSGRGAAMADSMLGAEEVKGLYGRMLSLRQEGLKTVTGDPVAAQMDLKDADVTETGGDVPLGGCSAGVSGITILPDGTLLPCRRLDVPVGNLRTDSLREVWATSELLRALRDRSSYGGACGECPRWDSCRGCRAIAYAHTKCLGHADPLAEDPQCFIYPEDG